MVTLKTEPKEGFYPLYVNEQDTVKGEFLEGKIQKEADHTIHVFGIFESGLSVEPLPIKISFHGKEYDGWDFQSKKKIKKKPYPVEKLIFDQLNDERFPAEGFTCKLLHAPKAEDYKNGKLPLSGIQPVEIQNLPALPEGSTGRAYSDAGETALKQLKARRSFFLTEISAFLGQDQPLESLSDFWELKENLSGEERDDFDSFVAFLLEWLP